MDSVGRMPTGPGTPASGTSVISDEAQAKVSDASVVGAQRADSGEFMVQVPSSTSVVDPAEVQRAQSGESKAQVKSATKSAKPGEDKAQKKSAQQSANPDEDKAA